MKLRKTRPVRFQGKSLNYPCDALEKTDAECVFFDGCAEEIIHNRSVFYNKLRQIGDAGGFVRLSRLTRLLT